MARSAVVSCLGEELCGIQVPVGIDYMIAWPCQPKEAISPTEITRLLKARAGAEHVLHLAREEGDSRSPDKIIFKKVQYRPNGEVTEQEISVQDLLDETEPLQRHAAHCERCSANIHGEPYGCSGYIPYPIEEATEKWLMDRLPPDTETTAGWLLSRSAADLGWDGEHAARLRTEGDMFFEGENLRIERGCGYDFYSFDSDQLFDMLFGVGDLQPPHMAMAALFLGIIPHDIRRQELGSILSNPERLSRSLDLGTLEVAGQSPQIRAVTGFLRAMCHAAQKRVELVIDS